MTAEGPENDELRGGNEPKYDLEERTAVFSENVIDFALMIKRNPVTSPLISQLVSAATSIGANYCEANNAESKRDFRHKIGICRKEALETKYWFRMIARAAPDCKIPARPLWQEAKELNLIFSKIWHSSSE
jgi:four helix bundle protein